MKISKKSWIYKKVYWFRDKQPKAVSPSRFYWDIFLALIATGFYWLVVGIACFLLAGKPAKKGDDALLCVDVRWWPKILGHLIWPLSLIGLGLIIWPFVDYKSWIKYDIFFPITLFSLCMLVWCIFTKKTWQEIKEATKIVFTENGGI